MDPYLKPGRLADVIAALQVIAAAKRPEREIKDWAYEFERNRDAHSIDRWTSVFEEHREFFLTYRLEPEKDLKAALRWRYAFKTVNPETGEEYTPVQAEALPEEQRSKLTSKPLAGDQIQTLLNTAIGLHTRAIQELTLKKWWVPLIASFGGAVLGALLSGLLGIHK
jgi:hypothetical protein